MSRGAMVLGCALLLGVAGLLVLSSREDGVAPRAASDAAPRESDTAHPGPADASGSSPAPEAKPAEDEETRSTKFQVTSDGRPVVGAQVALLRRDVEGVTGVDGTVVLTHPRESPSYAVRKEGFLTAFGNTRWRELQEVGLTPGQPASGRVLDANTGQPIAGARVRVRSDDKRPRKLDLVQTTDDAGEYTLAGLGDKWPIRLAAGAPGFAPVELVVTQRPLPDLRLGGGGMVHGTVKDASGKPLSNAEVVVPYSGAAWLISREAWERTDGVMVTLDLFRVPYAVTDGEGRYSVQGLEIPAEYALVAFRETSGKAVRKGVRLVASQRTLREDLRIDFPSSLTVWLSDEAGRAVRTMRFGVDVRRKGEDHRSARARYTDDRNGLRYADLEPGEYVVEILVPNFLPKVEALTVAPGEHRVLRVTLDSGAALAGVVVDGDGKPVAGMEVDFYSRGTAPEYESDGGEAVTDEQGRFRIAGLTDCVGALSVREPRDSMRAYRAGVEGKYAPVTLPDVRSGKADLRIVLPRAASVIFATEPTRVQMKVSAFVDRRRSALRIGKVDAKLERDGDRYRIVRLPTGQPLSLYLRARGFAVESRKLEALQAGETRDLGTIRLGHGETLRGVVRNKAGAPVKGATVSSLGGWSDGAAKTDESGKFELRNLRAGDHTVWARADGYVSASVNVAKGAEDDLVHVTLSEGGVLKGRVLDVDGEPAIGQDLMLWALLAHDPEPAKGESVDHDARAAFEHRLAAGRYILTVDEWGGEDSRELRRVEFVIREGETTTLVVRLR